MFLSFLKDRKIDLIVFFSLFFIFSLIAVFFPQFPSFDYLNYHWYNVIAFLDGRHDFDLFAANIRSYFNPLIDMPAVLFSLKLNQHPILLFSLFSLDETFFVFILYKIIKLFSNRDSQVAFLCPFLSILYVVTAPLFVKLTGFGQNDFLFSVFVLYGFYFFLKHILNSQTRLLLKSFLLGTIIGLSFGLKLVAVSYVLLFALFFMIFRKHFEKPYQMLFLYILGSIAAFLLVHGYWCYFCYQKFGNPFFPFFNHIFHSPYANSVNLRVIDFDHIKASSLFDFLFFSIIDPGRSYHGMDNFTWDLRLPIFHCSIFIILLTSIISYFKKSKPVFALNVDYIVLFLFIVIPFMINTYLFGTYRYIISSIVFSGFILFFFLQSVLSHWGFRLRTITFSFVFILLSVIFFSKYDGFEFQNNIKRFNVLKGQKFLDYSYPVEYAPNSSVLILNHLTSVYILPNIKNVSFYGYYFPVEYTKSFFKWHSSYERHHIHSKYMEEYIQKLILSDKKLYVLYHYFNYPIFLKSLDYYNDNRNPKRQISNCKNVGLMFFGEYGREASAKVCEFN